MTGVQFPAGAIMGLFLFAAGFGAQPTGTRGKAVWEYNRPLTST